MDTILWPLTVPPVRSGLSPNVCRAYDPPFPQSLRDCRILWLLLWIHPLRNVLFLCLRPISVIYKSNLEHHPFSTEWQQPLLLVVWSPKYLAALEHHGVPTNPWNNVRGDPRIAFVSWPNSLFESAIYISYIIDAQWMDELDKNGQRLEIWKYNLTFAARIDLP